MIDPTLAPLHFDWHITERLQTGIMIVARSGALLFRFEPKTKTIYAWDKFARHEVAVQWDDLINRINL